jgi:hypothetical protein
MSVTKESLCGLNRNMFSGIFLVTLTALFRKCDIIEQEPHCTDIHCKNSTCEAGLMGQMQV